jgi:hypothetical protein
VTRYRVRDNGLLRQLMKAPRRLVPHTVQSLADQAGAPKSTIGFMLTGDRPVVSESVAEGVSEAFDVPLNVLFVREDSQYREEEDARKGDAR